LSAEIYERYLRVAVTTLASQLSSAAKPVHISRRLELTNPLAPSSNQANSKNVDYSIPVSVHATDNQTSACFFDLYFAGHAEKNCDFVQ